MLRKRIAGRQSRSRLIVLSIVVTLAGLAGVAAYIYMAYQRAASELIVERDRQVTYLSAARLANELSKLSDELVTVARSPEVYRGDVAAQLAALQQASRRLVVFDGGIVLLDQFGKVRATQPPRPDIVGNDWSDRDFFQRQLISPGIFYSDASSDGPDRSKVVVISVPVLDENRELAGVLAGMFRLGEPTVSAFYAGIVRLRIGQTGNTYVADSTGQILYDSAHNAVGQILAIPGLSGDALRGAGGAIRTHDNEDRDVVAAYAPVPGTAWTLVSEDDWAMLTSSTRPYARELLGLLALGMVLPALGVALLVRERNAELRERERAEHEARVGSLIQQTLLPKQVPILAGWTLAVHYQPASAAGGDFYDFLLLPDGRLMLALGCVTERGLRAAHVMATTRAVLRGSARRLLPPAATLEQGNDMLCPEMGPGACVTCLYGVLDPADGRLELANAGYNAPYRSRDDRGTEPPSSDAPLGLALATRYEQTEILIQPGECLVFYSNGLIEASSARGEPFGLSRLQEIVDRHAGDGQSLIEALVSEFCKFTGRGWIQQDDVTLVVLERTPEGRPVQWKPGNGHGA